MCRVQLFSLFLCLLLLSGCGSRWEGNISTKEFSEEELSLVEEWIGTAEHSMAFSFQVGKSYRFMEVWVEEYTNGLLTNARVAESRIELTPEIREEGILLLGNKQGQWALGVAISGGYQTTIGGQTFSHYYPLNFTSYLDESQSVVPDKTIALGVRLFAEGEEKEAYQVYAPEEYVGQESRLADYAVSYLVKCKFIQ